ncbi:MAG: hypothetical protein ABWX61_06610 [Paenisporosarcina sp.]
MNKSFKLITTLLIMLFLSFQYSLALKEQKEPPSRDWSRSLPTDSQGIDYFKLQSIPTDQGYSISRVSFKQWDYVECTKNFECQKIWSKDAFDYKSQTWMDGNTSYFIKGDTLFSSTKPDVNVPISSSVVDFTKTKDILVYWRKDNSLVVQRGNDEPVEYVTDEPVWASYIVGDQIFVVTNSVLTNTVSISKVNEKVLPFAQFKTKVNESIHSMDLFSLNENQYGISLEIGLKSAGSRQKIIRTAPLSKTNPEEPTFSDITFVDKVSGEKLFDMNYPTIFIGNNGTYMTFSATMFNEKGTRSNHVFVGEFNPEQIEASAVTKSGDLYTNPLMLNEETIIYYKKVGKHKEMMYSSTLEEKREMSAHGLKGDAVEAFHMLFSESFKGILLALLSFLWIIPASVICYIVGTQLQKRGNPFVSPIMFTAYMVVMFFSQYLVFSQILHSDLIASKTPYLSESWQVYMILLMASIVSVLPLLLSRTKINEDNANRAIVHATLLNLVILFVLLGPYFF